MVEKVKKEKKAPPILDEVNSTHPLYSSGMLLKYFEKAIAEEFEKHRQDSSVDSKLQEIHELLLEFNSEFSAVANRLNAHFLKSLSDEIHTLSISYKCLEHQNTHIIDRLTKIEEKKWWKFWV